MRGRIDRILLILDEAETMDDMNIPGFRLHPLTGDREGCRAFESLLIGESHFVSKRAMCLMFN